MKYIKMAFASICIVMSISSMVNICAYLRKISTANTLRSRGIIKSKVVAIDQQNATRSDPRFRVKVEYCNGINIVISDYSQWLTSDMWRNINFFYKKYPYARPDIGDNLKISVDSDVLVIEPELQNVFYGKKIKHRVIILIGLLLLALWLSIPSIYSRLSRTKR
jgi:hypothetical protein